jgi:hypothetical protein
MRYFAGKITNIDDESKMFELDADGRADVRLAGAPRFPKQR